MAELEFAGIKFKGGRMVAVIMGLSTLAGGLYGAFEFYKDYMNMREMIENYVAPDQSGFDNRLAVVQSKVDEQVELVRLTEEVARDIKTDLKAEINQQQDIIYKIETKTTNLDRQMRDVLRSFEKEMRGVLHETEERIASTRRGLREDFRTLDRENKKEGTALRNKVDTALDRLQKNVNRQMDKLQANFDKQMADYETRLNDKVQKALDNPLNN